MFGKNNRRSQKRISKRFPVRFGTNFPKHAGFARNMSLNGLEISSDTVFYPNTVLRLVIEVDKKTHFEAKGTVRWISAGQSDVKAKLRRSMGIDLIERPDEYVEHVQSLREEFDEKRYEPRFGKSFKVVFRTPKEVVEKFTQDISLGGMFVITDDPPALNTPVTLEMIFPDIIDVLRAEGNVVHVVSRESAEKAGINPGFGVQFVRFLENDRELLEKYINEMKARMADE